MKGSAERKDIIHVLKARTGRHAGTIDRVIRQGSGGKSVVTYAGAIYEVKQGIVRFEGDRGYYIEI